MAGLREEQSTATLQSTIQRLTAPDKLPLAPTHPFASSENVWLALDDIFASTSRISESLNSYLSLPLENPKLISLLRQHTAASNSLYLSEQNSRQTILLLKAKVGVSYGEDVPLDRASIVDWCISRLENWGSSVGMEAFKEEEKQGKMTVVLGGKVLVMDIDFNVVRSDPSNPRLCIGGLKTSYASPSGGASTDGLMNGFFAQALTEFLTEVQRPSEEQDTFKAASLSRTFCTHLQYLMKLDHLASQEGDSGIRWFNNIDVLALAAEHHAQLEAKAVARSLSFSRAPLDVFLARAHALPLPYLVSPCLTFLIYTSPLAYLNLLRTSLSSSSSSSSSAAFDIPSSVLRSQLSGWPLPSGITTASLRICDVYRPVVAPINVLMQTVARPTFSLDPSMYQFDHVFPEVPENPTTEGLERSSGTVWILDFTHHGKTRGVVMSQSRMREIEVVVNPFSQSSGPTPMDMIGPSSSGAGSWVDLLLNPDNPISPERYTSVYDSPSSACPRLHLRLTAPHEPGFFLEQIQVRNMRQVWSILEIVREQCWLNEILSGCKWEPEGFDSSDSQAVVDSTSETNEAELQAILNGTFQPYQIPINVYFPSYVNEPSLFDQGRPTQNTRVTMTLPERPPISGLVEISVSLDTTRPRGVSVNVGGVLSSELKVDALEEACRRGGIFSLPGRVWSSSTIG